MIIGNCAKFALESSITQAFIQPSCIALGYFLIIVEGRRYGLQRSDATILACSFDEVARRVRERGIHTAPFAAKETGGEIADAFRRACYTGSDIQSGFGMSTTEFRDLIYSNRIVWAPDGDAAFDDGSFVLQFDIQDRVRLIAFRTGQDGLHDAGTLSDKLLDADEYYGVLKQWHSSFEAEWISLPRTPVDVGAV
jgi:hypothetical protein